MLEPRFVRENPDAVRAMLSRRGTKVDLDRFLALDTELREIQRRRDDTRAEQKQLAKQVPSLEGDERSAAMAKSKELGQSIKPMGKRIQELEAEFKTLHLAIPNMLDDEVPPGLAESDNVELRTWGDKPSFDFDIRDHLDLCEGLDLLDMKRAARVAGSRTYFLRGDLVLLELAVLRYALDLIASRGYLPLAPPFIVNRSAMEGTGYLPFGADQAYECARDDGFLIGTSEVPITSLHGGELLSEDDLPRRYAGYSACFRREAGAAGKDTRGLYRVHQFMKVEQVVFCHNDERESRQLHEEILANAEDVLQGLRLPYRVIALCGGDIGRSSAFTYDIETWMPGRDNYGETHSASRYYEYQARRLGIRYRPKGGGKPLICHTLNNTVVASPRILVAILENNQRADGSVQVPEVLVPFMGKEVLARAK